MNLKWLEEKWRKEAIEHYNKSIDWFLECIEYCDDEIKWLNTIMKDDKKFGHNELYKKHFKQRAREYRSRKYYRDMLERYQKELNNIL